MFKKQYYKLFEQYNEMIKNMRFNSLYFNKDMLESHKNKLLVFLNYNKADVLDLRGNELSIDIEKRVSIAEIISNVINKINNYEIVDKHEYEKTYITVWNMLGLWF